ncbi:MAG: hypothetical protein ACI87W_002212 [Halieaceae bacterium]|jgi:hypothetical protein
MNDASRKLQRSEVKYRRLFESAQSGILIQSFPDEAIQEAMSSHRPYRAALRVAAALAELSSNPGTLYDADVVDAALAIFREYSFEIPAPVRSAIG